MMYEEIVTLQLLLTWLQEDNDLSTSVKNSLTLRCYRQLSEIEEILADGTQLEDATMVSDAASALTDEYYEEVAKVKADQPTSTGDYETQIAVLEDRNTQCLAKNLSFEQDIRDLYNLEG
jgi:hypothetical protein